MCDDSECSNCRFNVSSLDKTSNECISNPTGGSFQLGKPLLYSWQASHPQVMNFVANIFFTKTFCAFYPSYIEPQILSTHVNLGIGNETCQNSVAFLMANESTVEKAFWVRNPNFFLIRTFVGQ